MPRRVSLPAADDLFRTTREEPAGSGRTSGVRAVPDRPESASGAHAGSDEGSDEGSADADDAEARKPSGRVRHDEKMTVYVTSVELLEIEDTRLGLRRAQGLSVDRGRLVREAVAMVLADYDAHGDDSALVRRLNEG